MKYSKDEENSDYFKILSRLTHFVFETNSFNNEGCFEDKDPLDPTNSKEGCLGKENMFGEAKLEDSILPKNGRQKKG